MSVIAIVYHSGFGHTEVLAKAVARGAEGAGAKAQLIKINAEGKIDDSEWAALDAAAAIVFGTPTYMGSVSGPFKMFVDATSKPWFAQKWKDKISGGFTNSASYSGDKLSTLTQLAILAAQHGMVWVGTGLMANGNTPESHNRLGSFLGVMAQSDNAPADQTPPKGDIETAELYGARIAGATKRWG